MRHKKWQVAGHLITVFLLTVITQIGGVIWMVTLGVTIFFPDSSFPKWRFTGCFFILYSLSTICIIPFLAPLAGRVPLPVKGSTLEAKSVIYCFLNRHYLRSEARSILLQKASLLQANFPKTKLYYLDAGFPFGNGFPLFPHLSHNDGRKIDLCFFYKKSNGERTNFKPARSGYGVFEGPKKEEQNMTDFCQSKGYIQYDYPKFLTLGKRDDLIFDELRTREMLSLLVREKRVKKVFVEPHLKARLGMNKETKIRFQGCKAVRHDDHIHVEFSE